MAELPRFVPRDRIIAFSDGVFAVVITILVLAIEVPADTFPTGAALISERSELGHQILIYVVAFWYIGMYWSQHALLFGSVKHVDRPLVVLNLLVLLPVTLLPFVTQLMGAHRADWRGVAAFAITNLFTALPFAYMWKRVSTRAHLHLSPATVSLARRARRRIPYLLAVLGVAVLLAVVDVRAGTGLLLLLPAIHFYNHVREPAAETEADDTDGPVTD